MSYEGGGLWSYHSARERERERESTERLEICVCERDCRLCECGVGIGEVCVLRETGGETQTGSGTQGTLHASVLVMCSCGVCA